MSEQTEVGTERIERLEPWQGGVVGGLVAGAVMGAVMSVQTPEVVENAIPALWGLSGGAAGWAVHLSNGAIFGVFFAALARYWPAGVRTVGRSVLTGAAYGVLLWIVAAGLVMPVWLDAVGFASPPPVPNLALVGLVTHLVYGVVLGVGYPLLVRPELEF